SCVKGRLRLQRANSDASPRGPDGSMVPANSYDHGTAMTRVLVIEDDRRTAAEIAAALGDYGFDVECAYTGRDGLLQATSEKYDAIVLDRMLPGDLDGLGVLATLRTIRTETPVLILSALSAVDERVRGLRAGGDDYLTKPFEAV